MVCGWYLDAKYYFNDSASFEWKDICCVAVSVGERTQSTQVSISSTTKKQVGKLGIELNTVVDD